MSQLQFLSESLSELIVYINEANNTTDYVERLRLISAGVVGNLANVFLTSSEKVPLKADIGETYNASLDNGTQFYAEQVSVAPSITRILVIGPNRDFIFSGQVSV
jgi:hypothetical protein